MTTYAAKLLEAAARERLAQVAVRRAALAADLTAEHACGCDGLKPTFIEVMADDANEKVRRVRLMDPIERAFRRDPPDIDENSYRLARCIERDFLSLLPASGGLRLVRLKRGMSESFTMMPPAPGVSTRAPQARHEYALDNLRRVEAALGAAHAYDVLRRWAGEGFAPYEIDSAYRKRKGWALDRIQRALSAIAEAQLYEREKWNITVWKEAG